MTDLLITLTAHENDGTNVSIAFTMGLKALEKGHSVTMVLLSKAVYLSQKGYADKINVGAPFKPVNELLPTFLSNGGQLQVCGSCLELNGVGADELIEEAQVINADQVIEALMSSQKSLQLN